MVNWRCDEPLPFDLVVVLDDPELALYRRLGEESKLRRLRTRQLNRLLCVLCAAAVVLLIIAATTAVVGCKGVA